MRSTVLQGILKKTEWYLLGGIAVETENLSSQKLKNFLNKRVELPAFQLVLCGLQTTH